MKSKTLIACAFAACALPLAPAWATNPTGPQGIDLRAAIPVALPTFAEIDLNSDGMISRNEYATVSAAKPPSMRSAGPLMGPSWATNPPVPAP